MEIDGRDLITALETQRNLLSNQLTQVLLELAAEKRINGELKARNSELQKKLTVLDLEKLGTGAET